MTQENIQPAFRSALAHHQAGRLREAEALYREVLKVQPVHAEAIHYLGVIAYQAGQAAVAVDLYRRSIRIKPEYAEAHCNLGNALRESGLVDESIAACRTAIALKPTFAEAYCNLASALVSRGDADGALDASRRAIELRPNLAEAYVNLGNAFQLKADADRAIAAFERAIALRPNYPGALSNLGSALRSKGELDRAIQAFEGAIQLDPKFASAFNNMGLAMREAGRLDQSIAAFGRAIALKPDFAEAYSNLGVALKEKGLLDKSLVACRRAVDLKPGDAEALGNLGVTLKERGQLEESVAVYRRAIAANPDSAQAHYNLAVSLKAQGLYEEARIATERALVLWPDLAEAHHNLAILLLLQGDLAGGLREYEWRWRVKGFPSPLRNFAQPQWDGSPFGGKTLLLHAEQGLGDSIQCIRYLPMVAERGGQIVVECQSHIGQLIRGVAGRLSPSPLVVLRGERLPGFDLHCPLLSLPCVFGTTLRSIPDRTPYLHAEPERAGIWRDRVRGTGPGLKIGLAWAGNPVHQDDRARSMVLEHFTPLVGMNGVRFFSLQKGSATEQIRSLGAGSRLIDWSGEFTDFGDTAALMQNLDLVITVDTAVAHVAGALGRPTWVLLPFVPDWRWMLGREDSPWYRTIRLFRQPSAGDWGTVVTGVVEELAPLVESGWGQ
jgi:tetratricopeptide (TPR) repeat protein